MTTIHEEPNGERWMDVAWASVQQEPENNWIDCTLGGLLCLCGGYVGMLMWDDDQPRTCPDCGRAYRLSVSVETLMVPFVPSERSHDEGGES